MSDWGQIEYYWKADRCDVITVLSKRLLEYKDEVVIQQLLIIDANYTTPRLQS